MIRQAEYFVKQIRLVREFRECFRLSQSETCAYAKAVYKTAAEELFEQITAEFRGAATRDNKP